MYLYFVAFKTIEHGGFGNIIISLDEEITSKNFKNSYLTMIETIEHEMNCNGLAFDLVILNRPLLLAAWVKDRRIR